MTSKPKPPEVKVIVLASDPTGAEAAFVTSGWQAAHNLRHLIDSYPNSSHGWSYMSMHRLVSQREVR